MFFNIFNKKPKQFMSNTGKNLKLTDYSHIDLYFLSNVAGGYAHLSMDEKRWSLGKECLEIDLDWLYEKAVKSNDEKLFNMHGLFCEYFTMWFQRKDDDKGSYLNKAIQSYEKALSANFQFIEAQINLGCILIEKVQVRNLEKGIALLDKIDRGLLEADQSTKVDSAIKKAKKWLGDVEISADFDYSKLNFYPLTDLIEERKNARAITKTAKKEKDEARLKTSLNHLYRLGIIYHWVLCYYANSHHFKIDRNEKELVMRLIKNSIHMVYDYSYESHGKLNPEKYMQVTGYDSFKEFISNADYKNFEKVFGINEKSFDPLTLIKL